MKTDIKHLNRILREISCVLTRRQKIKCFGIVILIIIGSVLETLGVSIVIPFVQSILTPQELLKSRYFAKIASNFNISSNNEIVIFVGGCLVALYVVKNLFLMFSSYMQVSFRRSMECELSNQMLRTYMTRPYVYFLDTNSADVLRGITEDVDCLYSIVENTFVFMSSALTIALIMVFLFVSNPSMGFVLCILGMLSFLILVIVFRRILAGVGQRYIEAETEKKKYAYQAINGIKEINVMQRVDFFVEQYCSSNEKSRRSSTKYHTLNSYPMRIIEAVCISGIIVAICIVYSRGLVGNDFVSQMAAFAVAAFRLLPLVGTMVTVVNSFVYYWKGADNTYNNTIEVRQYEKEKSEYIHEKIGEVDENSLILPMEQLVISNIYWKYPKSEKSVLDDLSLAINRNESVGIVGESGSGKTTLSDIIMGLYRPQKGTVEIDGVDIYAIPKLWSRKIGYVPQEVFLTDDSVRANVSFGLYDDEIDDDKVWDALEMAQLRSFVENLPNGLDTLVGERGVKFSGGQRQRIAIARALYYNPDIMIFDEATSSLDNETEKAVMESIDALLGRKTLIIIAHRLSTIRNCDTIYEIVGGKAIKRNKSEIFDKES